MRVLISDRRRCAFLTAQAMLAGMLVPLVASGMPALALEPLTPVSPPSAVAPPDEIRQVTAPGPTEVTGSILVDTVWGPLGSPYVLRSDLYVSPQASLTLLPGTVVKISGGSIRITGQMLALGEPGRTVIFTSLKDDSVLGDTNGDGASSSPSPGDWKNLHFDGTHETTPGLGLANLLDYVEARYGGAGDRCRDGLVEVENNRLRLIVSNSTLTSSAGQLVEDNTGGGRFVGLYGNTFANGSGVGCGVSLDGQSEVVGNRFVDVSFTAQPQKLRLWRNHFGAHVSLWAGTSPTPQERVDIRYNSFVGTIDDYGGFDLRSNWWGYDANYYPICNVWPGMPWHPQLNVTVDSNNGCEDDFIAVGYRSNVLPALSGSPSLTPPAAIREWTAARSGPVNLVSGAVTYQTTDIGVEDAGKRLSVTRTFRSDKLSGGDAGPGWTSSYAEALSPDGAGGSMLALSDGDSVPFGSDVAAGYVPAPGMSADYTTGADGSSITTSDDVTYQFDLSGELNGILLGDPGHRVDVQRSGGKVSKVTGVSGRYVSFSRADGRLITVADSTGRSASLSYEDGRLNSVSGVDGKSEVYTYDSSGRLTRVTSPGGVVRLAVAYDSQGRAEWFEQKGSGRTTLSYDTSGRRTTATLANGDTIEYRYDAQDRLVTETRGGISRHLVYNGDGIAIAQIEGVPSGPMTGYAPPATTEIRDARGDMVRSVDPVGRSETTTYNSRHRPLTTTRADNTTIVRAYDGDGRLISVTDPMGKVWRYAFNSRGQVTTQTDPLGRTRSVAFTSNGDVRTVADETGATTTMGVDAQGRRTSMIDALGNTRTVALTAWDEKASVTSGRNGITTVSYNDDRQQVSITDPAGGVSQVEYDSMGRRSAIVDPEGGRSTIEYDVLGREVARTDAKGGVTRFTYTPQGWLATTTDATGGVTAYTYDPAGRAYRITDALGRVKQQIYDRAGQPVSVWTADGGRSVIQYDLIGRRSGLTTPLGNLWRTEYDATGHPTRAYDPLGKFTLASYDAIGRMVSTTDEVGVVTTLAYDDSLRKVTRSDSLGVIDVVIRDAMGRESTFTDGSGVLTAYTYDADGNRTGTTDPAGSWGYEFDLAGRMTAQVDSLGHRTTATYDRAGRQISQSYPDSTQQLSTYDTAGNLVKITDQVGAEWSYAYDAVGRLTSSTDPLGDVTSAAYDANGQLISVTDPTGVVRHAAYDPVGRIAVTWDAMGGSFVSRYDLDGRLAQTTEPSGSGSGYTYDKRGLVTQHKWGTGTTNGSYGYTNYTYDNAGRVTIVDDPYRTTLAYDARGRVTSQTNAISQKTAFTYDGAGRIKTRATPSGKTTSWSYDTAGRISQATDPLGNATTYGWDLAGQLTSVTLPRGGVYRYGYDANGRLRSQLDPLNAVTNYVYDGAGRPTTTTLPSGQTVSGSYDLAGRMRNQTADGQTRTFAYDAAGRLTSAVGNGITLGYAYDNRGLLIRSTDGLGETAYGYDHDGRVTTVVPTSGPTTTYTYDLSRGLLASVRGATNLNFTYNIAGDLLTQAAVEPSRQSSYRDYDSVGRLSKIEAPGYSARINYTPDSQIGTVCHTVYCSSSSKRTTYVYDDAGRLGSAVLSEDSVQLSSETYTWDADGNRSSVTRNGGTPVTAAYDLADRFLSTSDGTTIDWDVDGRQRSQGAITYDYNPFGELVSASTPDTTVSYTRDPLGRVAGRSTGESYSYDGLHGQLRAAQTGSGPLTTLVRAPDGELLASATAGATAQRPSFNPHSDVAAFGDDNSYSSVQWRASYDAFGKVQSTTGTSAVPLGYQGMLTDQTTGLVDMGFRHYDPGQGRFVTPDSIVGALGKPISFNRYLYGNADPINHFDPDGHWPDFLDDYIDWWTDTWQQAWDEPGDASTSDDPTARFMDGVIKGVGSAVKGVAEYAGAVTLCAKDNQASCNALERPFTKEGAKEVWHAATDSIVNCLSDGDAGQCGRATVSLAEVVFGAKGVTRGFNAFAKSDLGSQISTNVRATLDDWRLNPDAGRFGRPGDATAGPGSGIAEVYLDPDVGSTGHASVRIFGRVDGEVVDLHTELVGMRTAKVQIFDGELGTRKMTLTIPLPDLEMARDFVKIQLRKPHVGRFNPTSNNCVTYTACVLRAGGNFDIPDRSGEAMDWLWNKTGGVHS